MIKLFAFDLDGTLLQENQKIDAETLKAIHSFESHGIKYAIATGRNYGIVRGILEDNDLDCDIILNNGHEFISKDRRTRITYAIDKKKLAAICEVLFAHKFKTVLHADNGNKYIFMDPEDYYQEHLLTFGTMRGIDTAELSTAPLFSRDSFLENTYQISSLDELGEVGILKLDNSNTDKNACAKAVELLSAMDGVLLNTSYDANVEVCDDTVDKGTAVLEVAKIYEISPDEIATFGDGDNDIGLLKVTKHSFAMGNCRDVLREIATHVTDTNENQGVLKGIRKILAQENNITI